LADGLFVSPVSAWKIGMLARPKAGREFPAEIRPPAPWRALLDSNQQPLA
jgi:hypothetical protein